MIKYTEHKLDNGLKIFLAPMQETQAVTIFFIYKVGSRYESLPQNGLSHFLEHMFFKGTEKRPRTFDIAQELDGLGASYNAYTSEEYTGYYVSAAAEHFPIALDVLTDMLYGSKFEAEEIEREKGVICEEIKMYHDNPMDYLHEVTKELIYGDTPLGRDIAGTQQSVKAFVRDQFVDYKNRFYGPENTVVAIAGNPNKHDWLKALEARLTGLSAGQKIDHEPQSMVLTGSPVKIGNRPIDQIHLNLLHYGYNHTHPKMEIVDVMTTLFGGTMSSRLNIEVRERRGLAYYAWSGRTAFDDIGAISATAGIDPTKLDEALEVILNQINRLKTEPVEEAELYRTKQNLKGRLSLRLEDSDSIARYLAYDEVELGKIIQPEEYIAKVEKVTASDIMEVANELFKPEQRKLALVGPLGPEEETRLCDAINN